MGANLAGIRQAKLLEEVQRDAPLGGRRRNVTIVVVGRPEDLGLRTLLAGVTELSSNGDGLAVPVNRGEQVARLAQGLLEIRHSGWGRPGAG